MATDDWQKVAARPRYEEWQTKVAMSDGYKDVVTVDKPPSGWQCTISTWSGAGDKKVRCKTKAEAMKIAMAFIRSDKGIGAVKQKGR